LPCANNKISRVRRTSSAGNVRERSLSLSSVCSLGVKPNSPSHMPHDHECDTNVTVTDHYWPIAEAQHTTEDGGSSVRLRSCTWQRLVQIIRHYPRRRIQPVLRQGQCCSWVSLIAFIFKPDVVKSRFSTPFIDSHGGFASSYLVYFLAR
jgi:hypothetical protein